MESHGGGLSDQCMIKRKHWGQRRFCFDAGENQGDFEGLADTHWVGLMPTVRGSRSIRRPPRPIAGITEMHRLRGRTCERVRCTKRSQRHSAAITVSAAGIKGLSAAKLGGQQTGVIPKASGKSCLTCS